MNAAEQRQHLTPTEVMKLMKSAAAIGRYGKRDALMIRVAWVHGLRASELCDLKWSDVDLDGRTLYVRRLKGSKNATHPLTGDVVRALRRLGPDTGHVFTNERGGPLSRNGFGKIVRRAGQAAGIEPALCHPHALRHATGYALANRGVDTRSLQSYLGHSNIQHTVRYTATSPSRFKGMWQD
jgi:type 1 fimbriae regulatory protein FimB/type 1 fimbriae regulatory protein FimE